MKTQILSILWLLCSICVIILGVACIVFPDGTMRTLSYFAALLMCSVGIVSIYYYFQSLYRPRWVLFDGIISIVLALILLFGNEQIGENFIPLVIAFWVLFKGIVWIILAFNMRAFSHNAFSSVMILGVICVILGLVFVAFPKILAFLLSFVVGLTLIVCGVVSVVFWKSFRG
ncbi:HdeD family acid-resistance protein [uncultured Helicobacter sp.]|uniref:HdeD family acid-resistance protein n=1 Tax=uncultured Helicobacter sp. TaxID=175537 RepID=UPI0037539DF8